jgi:hypothetical protein
MSEEIKETAEEVVEPEEQSEENIDNGDSEKSTEDKDEKDENVVPVSVLIAERNKRKKYQKMIEDFKPKVEVADELAELSKTDINGLKQRIADLKNKSQAQQQQYGNQNRQPQYNTTPYDAKIKALEEKLDNDLREREFERFANEGLLEINDDIRDDIMQYSKDKDVSVEEAAYARYGKVILKSQLKSGEKASKKDAARAAYAGVKGSAGAPSVSEKSTLSEMQKGFVQEHGLDASRYEIASSDDQEAIHDYYRKLKQKQRKK